MISLDLMIDDNFHLLILTGCNSQLALENKSCCIYTIDLKFVTSTYFELDELEHEDAQIISWMLPW